MPQRQKWMLFLQNGDTEYRYTQKSPEVSYSNRFTKKTLYIVAIRATMMKQK